MRDPELPALAVVHRQVGDFGLRQAPKAMATVFGTGHGLSSEQFAGQPSFRVDADRTGPVGPRFRPRLG